MYKKYTESRDNIQLLKWGEMMRGGGAYDFFSGGPETIPIPFNTLEPVRFTNHPPPHFVHYSFFYVYRNWLDLFEFLFCVKRSWVEIQVTDSNIETWILIIEELYSLMENIFIPVYFFRSDICARQYFWTDWRQCDALKIAKKFKSYYFLRVHHFQLAFIILFAICNKYAIM